MEIRTIVPVISIIVIAYLFVSIHNYVSIKNYLENLKLITYEKFGKEAADCEITEDEISKLYYINGSGIDDITFKDLELFRLFKKMNHTDSILGAQALYLMLRKQNHSFDYHNNLKKKIIELTEQEETTKNIKFDFAQVGFFKKSLLELLSEGVDYNSVKKYKLMSKILRFGIIFVVLIGIVNPPLAVLAALAIIFSNYTIDRKINKSTAGILYDIQNMNSIFKLSKKIEGYDISSLNDEITEIKELNKKLYRLNLKSKKVKIVYGIDDAAGFEKFFDILFLNRANKFFSIADLINEQKELVLSLYEVLGKINSYTALVSYKLATDLTFVEFEENDFILKAEDLKHPLLSENQISQSFDFTEDDILITGSNASGKSTFLRNIGIAAAFANSFGMAHAKKYNTSFFKVESAIDISDSLEEKMSYFMAETKAIKRMIEKSDVKKLLILDEIFKGTNTIDRISAAYNTLKYIAKDSTVIAATHDIELTELLKEFSNYHFEENIKDNDISFDYKLKVGRAESRNAIEILRVMGYPSEIIEGSFKMAKELEEKNKN